MASPYTPTSVTAGFSAVTQINANFTAIESAFTQVLNRTDSSTNTMTVDLDMNSNKILNVPTPTATTDVVRLLELNNAELGLGTLVAVTPTTADSVVIIDADDSDAYKKMSASGILTMANITATTTELGYVGGVTSAIQTQIDGKQASDPALLSIAGLTTVADQYIYTTAADTYAAASITAFGRSLIDDAASSNARTTLGLGTIATQNASAVAITGGTATGMTTVTAATINGSNLRLNTNTISSTNTNGNVIISPNGTGQFKLFYSGAEVFSTQSFGLTVQDNSGASPALQFRTDAGAPQANIDSTSLELRLESLAHGATVALRGEDAGGTMRYCVLGDPDAECTLYYAGTEAAEASVTGFDVLGDMLKLPSHQVSALPTAASNDGGLIYVSNETGGSTVAFSDGTDWRRVQDLVIVS